LTNGDNDAYGEGSYYGNKGFRTAEDPAAEQYATAMESLLETVAPASQSIDASIAPDQDAYKYLTALAVLTERTIERYQEQKTRRETLDYDDLIELTVGFLTDVESDDAAHVREKVRYIMVDEFQDTNDRQWELVQALATANQSFDGDNVFVVGDKKQSIYRFRDADVTVFDTAQAALDTANTDHSTPDDGPPLVTNFRTVPDTLRAINGLFDGVFSYGGTEPFEATAQPLRPGRSNDDGIDPITEYMPIPVDSDLRDRFLESGHDLQDLPESEPADIEATAIANRIAAMLNGDVQVSTGDSDRDGRSVSPDDIAVLIRSRGDLKDYERALREASIPYTVVKGEGFYETPEIRALVSLFQALADPSEEIALYATLRSPLCGLTDEEIATAYDPDRPLWECLKASENEIINTVVEDFDRWRAYAGATEDATGPRIESWSVLADRIFEETGYMTAVAADERGSAAVSNLDKFREKLREFDASGVPSIERVVERFTEQATQGRAEAEANVAEESATVKIMTIHEAKGQEFPVVVVPGLGRGFLDRGRISNGSVEFELVPVEGERTPVLGLSVPGDWGEDSRATLFRHVARDRRRAEEYAFSTLPVPVQKTISFSRGNMPLTRTNQQGSKLQNLTTRRRCVTGFSQRCSERTRRR
jgi:ATP-dependent helicase/nuclease subunit A